MYYSLTGREQRKGENLLVESITVPSRAVGRIVGKGGASIQSIREETGAQISIADDQPPDAMVEIRGTLDAVSAAKNAIMAISAEVMSEITIIMIIQPKYHGTILGKDGQNLKDIISRAQGPSRGRLIVQLYGLFSHFCYGAVSYSVPLARQEMDHLRVKLGSRVRSQSLLRLRRPSTRLSPDIPMCLEQLSRRRSMVE